MKYLVAIFVPLALAMPLVAQEKTQFKDQKDKASYAIGLNIGLNINRQKLAINPDVLSAGLKDGIAGKPQMTEAEVRETMMTFEKEMEDKENFDENGSEDDLEQADQDIQDEDLEKEE